MKKRGNHQKLFSSIAGSCEHFQSSRIHSSMNVENAIEKLQRITKEKETQKSEHKWRQEEEVELLKKIEAEKELRRIKHEGALNIQPLAIRSLPHSSSSLECEERKVYIEKI